MKIVNVCYGSLDDFPDARTVRIMRGQALNYIATQDRVMGEIKDDIGRAEYFETFAADISEAKNQLEKLDDWLAKRGLTP